MGNHFEVCFRGENETSLLPWRPTDDSRFGCTATEAQQRFDDLIEAGEEARTIDGVVPYVVEIRKVRRALVSPEFGDVLTIDSMLVSYAEQNAVQWGPWAKDASAA